MSIQLNGTTGIDNISINPTTPNTGQFSSLTLSTGSLAVAIGQALNVTTGGSQRLRIDTTGNVQLLNSAASFQNAAGHSFSPYSLRNKIINGNFDYWQRGTSQTSNGYGSDDRWFNTHVGSTKTNTLQNFAIGQTEVEGNPRFYSRTTVTSVAGAGNYVLKSQRVEDVTLSSGKTMTLSFWARANANKNIAVEFLQDFGTGGTPSAQVYFGTTTFSLTTTWQKFTTTVTFPSVSGKSLGTNSDHWYAPVFWFEAGSNWNSRTNSLGQQSGTFDIAQVQLEEGSVATPFEQRPYGLELSLCQRYYEVVAAYQAFVAFGTATGGYVSFSYVVKKRAVPTITSLGSQLAFLGTSNTNITITPIGVTNNLSTSGGAFAFSCTGATAGSAGFLTTTSAGFSVSAEL